MSLLEEAAEYINPIGSRCTLGRLLQALDETERTDLQEALDSELPSTAIAAALKARGGKWYIAAYSIGRHRRGACRCH